MAADFRNTTPGYAAVAWILLEAGGAFSETWLRPATASQVAFVVLVTGFGITAAILAWLHGEGGRQGVSGIELLCSTSWRPEGPEESGS